MGSKYLETGDEADRLCVCEDHVWLIQLIIAGEIVDEYLCDIRTSDPDSIAALSVRHLQTAVASGEPYTASILCPTCGGGTVFSGHGVVVVEMDRQGTLPHQPGG